MSIGLNPFEAVYSYILSWFNSTLCALVNLLRFSGSIHFSVWYNCRLKLILTCLPAKVFFSFHNLDLQLIFVFVHYQHCFGDYSTLKFWTNNLYSHLLYQLNLFFCSHMTLILLFWVFLRTVEKNVSRIPMIYLRIY